MSEGIEARHARDCPSLHGGRCKGGRCPSYRASVYIPGGERRKATFASERQARAWRRETLRAVERGLRGGQVPTIREAGDELVDGMERGEILNRSGDPYKPTTTRSYRDCLARYVTPEIGGVRLDELRRQRVQKLADDLRKGSKDASTVRNALMPLRVIYRRALRDGIVVDSPVDHLDLAAVRGVRETIVEPDEAARMIAKLPLEHDRVVWAAAFYAGLRRGELRALTFDDYHGGEVLHVDESLTDRNEIGAPKSRAGTRLVPVLDELAEILDPWVDRAFREHDRRGDDFIFGMQRGHPFSASKLAARARRVWGNGAVTLHDARHTFASLLLAASVPMHEVSRHMGHASIQTTVDIYGKLMPKAGEQARDRVRKYLDTEPRSSAPDVPISVPADQSMGTGERDA